MNATLDSLVSKIICRRSEHDGRCYLVSPANRERMKKALQGMKSEGWKPSEEALTMMATGYHLDKVAYLSAYRSGEEYMDSVDAMMKGESCD